MNTGIIDHISTENKLPDSVKFSAIPAPNQYSFEMIEVTISGKSEKFIAEYKTEPRLMHLPYLIAINEDIGPILLIVNHISNPVKYWGS